MNAIGVARKPDKVQHYSGWRSDGGEHIDRVSRVISDDSVSYVQVKAIGVSRVNAISCKPEDHAIFDVDGLGLEKVYSLNAIAGAINGDPAECDHICTR